MILVDSYGWIEYFVDGPLANEYGKYLESPSEVVTPTIILYEVYKKIKWERSEEEALLVVAQIKRTKIVPLSETLALSAADLSVRYSLPMVDALVYATAREYNSHVVTSNPHFKNLANVILLEKKEPGSC